MSINGEQKILHKACTLSACITHEIKTNCREQQQHHPQQERTIITKIVRENKPKENLKSKSLIVLLHKYSCSAQCAHMHHSCDPNKQTNQKSNIAKQPTRMCKADKSSGQNETIAYIKMHCLFYIILLDRFTF